MAALDNAKAQDIDKTSFWWTGMCGQCHPGGGPSEYDRHGDLYYDVTTGQYGWQKRGLQAADVALDGDYAEVVTGGASTGTVRTNLWEKSGVAEADCLYCHRADRVVDTGKNMNWIWRTATLRGKDALVNEAGGNVHAFAAASTASQGWFSKLTLATLPAGQPPLATLLEIDYATGVANGSLLASENGDLKVAATAIRRSPLDYACWGCHGTPDLRKRGRVWFDPAKDVHYAGFNRLRDADASNDVAPLASAACVRCHPAEADHDIAKGNTTLGTARDDTDWDDFRTCRDCHDGGALADPEAPLMANAIHSVAQHMAVLSCDACHIPYKTDPADQVIDNATTGNSIIYNTAKFLSENPLDPAAAGDARWYPTYRWKRDKDGVSRLFPMKLLLTMWWADWDQKGTPGDLSDDVIQPLPLWRVRQVTGGTALAACTDDNGDGTKEVNRPEEILAYLLALKAADGQGVPYAVRPVLVKGGRVWHEDGLGGVTSFAYEGTGIKTESSHPFAADHNVLPADQAVGAGGIAGCAACHKDLAGLPESTFFDRRVLVDPFDAATGQPVYETVSDQVGLTVD